MKHLDIDAIVAQIERNMTNQPTGMSGALPDSKKLAAAELDISADLQKRASEYIERMYDRSHQRGTKLEGIGAEVLTREERHAQIARSLGQKRVAALSQLSTELRAIADRADSAGLRKQAADLRYAAEQLEFGFGDAAGAVAETAAATAVPAAASRAKLTFATLGAKARGLASSLKALPAGASAAAMRALPWISRVGGPVALAGGIGWAMGRMLDNWLGIYDNLLKNYEPDGFEQAMESLNDRISRAGASGDPADWDKAHNFALVLLKDKELPDAKRKTVQNFVTMLDSLLRKTDEGLQRAEEFLNSQLEGESGQPNYSTYFEMKMAELWKRMQADFAYFERNSSNPEIAAIVAEASADKNLKFLYRFGRKQITTERAMAVFRRGNVEPGIAAARMKYLLNDIDTKLAGLRQKAEDVAEKDPQLDMELELDLGPDSEQ